MCQSKKRQSSFRQGVEPDPNWICKPVLTVINFRTRTGTEPVKNKLLNFNPNCNIIFNGSGSTVRCTDLNFKVICRRIEITTLSLKLSQFFWSRYLLGGNTETLKTTFLGQKSKQKHVTC